MSAFWAVAAVMLAASPSGIDPARTVTFEGSRFHVVAVNLEAEELRVMLATGHGVPLRTLGGARRALPGNARALTNAGIFEKGERPTGLLVSRGVEKSPLNTQKGAGNFYLEPNGVFVIDRDGAHIVETGEYPPMAPGALEATQSGPLLLRRGKMHPAFSASSQNRVLRSGVGVVDARHLVLVVSEGPVSFHVFARFFLEQLKCQDALYLDGVISRLYAPELGLMEDKYGPFAGIIAVVPVGVVEGGSGR